MRQTAGSSIRPALDLDGQRAKIVCVLLHAVVPVSKGLYPGLEALIIMSEGLYPGLEALIIMSERGDDAGDQDVLPGLGDGRGSGLEEDTQHVETGDHASIPHVLTLLVVEVGRHVDDDKLHYLAAVVFRGGRGNGLVMIRSMLRPVITPAFLVD
jgi:hypothetical protein